MEKRLFEIEVTFLADILEEGNEEKIISFKNEIKNYLKSQYPDRNGYPRFQIKATRVAKFEEGDETIVECL